MWFELVLLLICCFCSFYVLPSLRLLFFCFLFALRFSVAPRRSSKQYSSYLLVFGIPEYNKQKHSITPGPSPKRHKTARPSKTAQDRPKTCQNGPKAIPRSPQYARMCIHTYTYIKITTITILMIAAENIVLFCGSFGGQNRDKLWINK